MKYLKTCKNKYMIDLPMKQCASHRYAARVKYELLYSSSYVNMTIIITSFNTIYIVEKYTMNTNISTYVRTVSNISDTTFWGSYI